MSKSSRFQIPPRAPAVSTPSTPVVSVPVASAGLDPVSRIEATKQFVEGASMVQSQAPAYEVKPKRLNVDLEPAVHQKLKLTAVAAGVSVADLIRSWITEKLG